MQSKLKKIGKYIIFLLWSNVFYGLAVYFVFTWLSKYSLLYGYLGNLALITIGLIWDEYTQKMLQSPKIVEQIKEEKNKSINYRSLHWITDNFISFKTALYLFYLFILLYSQLITFNPSIAGEHLTNFIKANDYSILFLIGIDTLITQFTKDRKKMNEITQNIERTMAEDPSSDANN